MTDSIERGHQVAAGLRQIADLIDKHPGLCPTSDPQFMVAAGKDDFAILASQLGGQRTKKVDEKWFDVVREFAGGVTLSVFAARDEVCEAVVVGTVTVIEDEVVTPAVTRRVEKKQDVIEWRCSSVLSEA